MKKNKKYDSVAKNKGWATIVDNRIVCIFLCALSLALVGYLLILLTKYTAISWQLIALGSAILASLGLLVSLFNLYGHLYQKGLIHKTIGLILTVMLCGLTACGIYYVKGFSGSIDEIIVEGDEKETLNVAFVTFDNKKIQSIKDLDGDTLFGYIDNEAFLEGNVLALQELKDQHVTVDMVPFDTYNDLLLALFNKDIDVAALPANYYDTFVVNEGYEELLNKTKVIHSFSKEVSINGANVVDKDLTTEPFSVLLMGKDEERTDTLILATFNPQRMTVTLTSIARDSFVPIACYKNNKPDKINHARVVSRSCTINTVENLLGIDIDFFIEINFKGLVEIVDAMGGLWLDSPVQFIGQTSSFDRGTYTVWVGKGYQKMDGEQVLAFARERHHMPEGDFSRQQNQQQIITTLASELLKMRDANKALSVIKAAGENVSTNFSLGQMTTLLNFGFDSLTNNYIGRTDGSLVFDIFSTRITGYSSYTYNEDLELPLWIYKLYQGSIRDNVAVIKRNLQLDTTLRESFNAYFDIEYPYFQAELVKEVYDEKEIHEKLPDFMPKMDGSGTIWTLEKALEWANARQWIALKAIPVVENDALYKKEYEHHRIIKQSVKYGVKTSKMTALTIYYIQHDLDCSISDYQKYSECSESNIVPNFKGMTYNDLQTWKSNHSKITVVEKWLNEGQEGYDENFAGKIIASSQPQYTKWVSCNYYIEVTLCDYPMKTLDVVKLSASSENEIRDWFKKNWYVSPSIQTAFSDTVASGKVMQILANGKALDLTKNEKMKSDVKVTVVFSKGAEIAVSDMTGSDVSVYQAWLDKYSKYGITENIIYETGDDTNDGKIKSQSLTAASYTIEEAKKQSVVVYKKP